MKHRFQVHGVIAAALLLLTGGIAAAELISNPECRTGAEPHPSFLGISGGNSNSNESGGCCTGTLGALVHDKKGNQFVLSTNTVLARVSPAKGHFKARAGEKIVQPGLVDTGCFKAPATSVGALSRWVPLNFGLNSNNVVDAAIARVKPGMFFPNGDILNIGPISSTTVAPEALRIGTYVQKMGRTSCLTEGQIDAIEATGKVAYSDNGCHSIGIGNATFSHQILIISTSTFADTTQGTSDSGALVLTEEACPRAIGLIFGSTSNGIVVVNPIDRVLKALKVQMVGGCSNSSPLLAGAEDLVAASDDPASLQTSIAAVRGVKARHEQDLLKLGAVVGTAISHADSPDQAAMLVMLKKDTPESRAQIPSQIEGVPIKVIETGEFHAL